MQNTVLYDKFKTINLSITPNNKYFLLMDCYLFSEKTLSASYEAILEQFKDIKFEQPYNKDTISKFRTIKIEHYPIPYLNFIYYFLFCEKERIPTLDEFIKGYFNFYCIQIGENKYQFKKEYDSNQLIFYEEELVGRLSRGYNSFNREIQVLYFLKQFPDLQVSYDLNVDLEEGIDITVKYKNKTYSLAIYVDTYRSNKYKHKNKNTIRHDYSKYNMIDIVAKFGSKNSNCYDLNGIWLFKDSYLKNIIKSQIFKNQEGLNNKGGKNGN